MTRLHILLSSEHLGVLEGRGNGVRIVYDRDLDPEGMVPLSLSMPLSRTRHRGRVVTHWLAALLPDREPLLMRWRRDFGVRDLYPESLLAHVGEDVAGAFQFVREDRLESVLERHSELRMLTAEDIAGLTLAAKRDSLPYDPVTSTGQFSLAGAQAKFALQRVADDAWASPSGAEPSTHIFKPAIPGLEDQDVGEVVSMRAAARMGLPTAHAFIAEFAGERVVGIERYDRWRDARGRWQRVHQEDLGQASGRDPRHKYESDGGLGIEGCGNLIREHCGQQDVETFARAIIYNYLIKGSDAHARNYSLLLTPGDVRLAPLYDLNSTLLFGAAAEARQLAMRVGGEAELASIGIGNWRLFASSLRLDEDWLVRQLRDMAAELPGVIAELAGASDIDGIADGAMRRLQQRSEQWCAKASQRLGRATI